MLRKIFVNTKKSIKLILLILIAAFLFIGIVAFLYKPTYRVLINGEQVGYTENKSDLQAKINDYIENGDGQNVAFVQVENLPKYQLCLLKKNIVTNDNEIYEKVKSQGTTYYRYYAVLENQEEKAYVSTFADAENIVNTLKTKNSGNIDNITIAEKYETELKDLITADKAVAKLYVEPARQTVQVAKTSRSKSSSSGSVNTSTNISSRKVGLGISLIKPVSGIITSRFAASSRIRSSAHTGLDIATSSGTPIVAAASGTVSFSGTKGSYGKMIVLNHSNGVQTYYAHCSALYVSAGQKVAQGQKIAAVGSTGNSTGPHLHLEIRINGVAYNPQNYLY